MIQPFGNDKASPVAVDIYRPCYPKINVPAYEIELQLYMDKNGNRYVIVNLTEEVKKGFLKEAINLLLEIYGVCYVFVKDIKIDESVKRQRCNWEILSQKTKKELFDEGYVIKIIDHTEKCTI